MNSTPEARFPHGSAADRYIIAAEQVFDGTHVFEHHAVIISGDRIEAMTPIERLRDSEQPIHFAGTLLPGFIDLHAHLLLDQTPQNTILRHGLTTIRDTGGPLVRPSGGNGRLRILGAGPILTAPGGYPVPVFGHDNIACEVTDVQTARTAVSQHAADGAALIKIALEPGGSSGAPWTSGHHGHQSPSPTPWPMLSLEVVRAIVEEAHAHGLIVSAHLSGPEGARLALDAGVDEWAHVPCDPLPDDLIARVAAAGVSIISTLDTESRCPGTLHNAHHLIKAGVRLLYGTDLAHTDVPWGIDAHELILMLQAGQESLTPLDVLSAATARAGEHLRLAPLGQLVEGAPADVIGVRGNPLERFKLLEYPDLVVSGGVTIVAPGSQRTI